MIEKLLRKLSEITEEYVNITCGFKINYGKPLKDIHVEWRLYIANTINTHFDTFEELKKYIIVLCEEIKDSEVEAAEKLCMEK